MPYQLPKDANAVKFFGKTTTNGNEAYMPYVEVDPNTGLQMQYYGKSTDVKPANSSVPIGAIFFEIDTQDGYMNDGTQWVVL